MLCNRIPHRRIRNLPSPSGPCVETSLSRELMRREPDPRLSHCPRRVYASARKTLKNRSLSSTAFRLVLIVCSATSSQCDVRKVLAADSIRQEVEDSLRRLSVDAIDLYQIHWAS